MQNQTVLQVNDLAKAYAVGGKKLQAFQNIDFSIQSGECVALVGESGCGKSSIAMTLMKLVEADHGSIVFMGQDISALKGRALKPIRQKCGIVFQNPYSTLNPRLSVYKLLEEPLLTHTKLNKRERQAKVAQMLETVGLASSMAQRMPHELSGGQRQRIGIARALMLDPELIILDEPTAALDVSVQATIINLLTKLKAERGLSYLFITHDLGLVERIADRVLVMYLGEIVESGPVPDVFHRTQHPYTRALLDSIPLLDPGKRDHLQALNGEVPSAMNKPHGCAFQSRCQYKSETCTSQSPQLSENTAKVNEPSSEVLLASHQSACFHPLLLPVEQSKSFNQTLSSNHSKSFEQSMSLNQVAQEQ